eukprot:5061906-Karenia_brevis.AAC.1
MKFISLSEQFEHFHSNVDRVPNTIELSDLFKYSAKQGNQEKCYSLESVVDLKEIGQDLGKGSLCDLIDKLQALNPEYSMVTEMKDLDDSNWL